MSESEFVSPFVSNGMWISAGLHCHSDRSDGGLSPTDTLRTYRDLGYQCVGLTDHRVVTPVATLSGGGFLAVDSIEVGGVPDVIGIGATRAPDPAASLSQRVSDLTAQGAFTIGAHPTYSAAKPSDYLGCPELMAIEIYNAYCEEAYANGIATEIWDMLLGEGMKCWGVAADDAHLNERKRYYSAAGRAWVEIWASELSLKAVLESLKAGAFYSTQGPKLTRISTTSGGIVIDCTPVQQVRWRTRGPCGYVQRVDGPHGITNAALPEWFNPRGYVRVELVDAEGLRAWSNPFYVRG